MTQTGPRHEIPKVYDPQTVEHRIYQFWTDGGYFTPKIDKSKKPFTVIMPPPNVTGELHMGHALTTALEDLMVRWHRMQGEPTLFLPGSDHAGIATQVVVERTLAADGISRHDLGREKFVERVWQWVDQYGSRIYEQLRRLGASCDWSRTAFTLNEGPSKAVRTTFVNLYKKGLIYRGERITNWCPHCRTALSDLEVKYQEEKASLYHIRYELEDGSDALVVATTRPETLLGDTAVAVNPEDERYKHFIGKKVLLPILKRPVPVISDEAVELEFGTGALKVTPGHDPTDFEIGQRHNLPIISIMNLDGTLNAEAGPYQGQNMADARKNIVEQLERDGLLIEVKPYQNSIGHCDRSGDVVEPIVSLQWYVSVDEVVKPARNAVANGDTQIIPERFTKVYFNWMDNIRDWCISRQLWWGHRIPVWYCENCGEIIVEYDDPDSCPKCDSKNLQQDEDVLDTWFSSGLWTHSTLGWPDKTEDIDYFYPTSVMETGYDILFFWVARMMMMGIENMGEAPFHTVYLHGLVLDTAGVKMSKTRGNVLDPLELIDMYGADALRFALTIGTSPGNNQRLNEQRLEASRNFANKLWNASRFVMSYLEQEKMPGDWHQPPKPVHRQDRWIVSRLNRVTEDVQRQMEDYNFGEAQRTVHDFMWHEYADWYIEMAKIRMRNEPDGPSPLPYLAHVLEQILRLLHPFMPYITEEIWQTLLELLPPAPEMPEALIIAAYPSPDQALIDKDAEREIGIISESIRAIRNLRGEFRINPSQKLNPAIVAPEEQKKIFLEESSFFSANANVDISLVDAFDPEGQEDVISFVAAASVFSIPMQGLVDLDKERIRLREEIEDIHKNLSRLTARLQDENFTSKAPEEVVDKERGRLEDMAGRRVRVEEILSRLGG